MKHYNIAMISLLLGLGTSIYKANSEPLTAEARARFEAACCKVESPFVIKDVK